LEKKNEDLKNYEMCFHKSDEREDNRELYEVIIEKLYVLV